MHSVKQNVYLDKSGERKTRSRMETGRIRYKIFLKSEHVMDLDEDIFDPNPLQWLDSRIELNHSSLMLFFSLDDGVNLLFYIAPAEDDEEDYITVRYISQQKSSALVLYSAVRPLEYEEMNSACPSRLNYWAMRPSKKQDKGQETHFFQLRTSFGWF
jgi:hypothetical protein